MNPRGSARSAGPGAVFAALGKKLLIKFQPEIHNLAEDVARERIVSSPSFGRARASIGSPRRLLMPAGGKPGSAIGGRILVASDQ
jgi:hypothetical protein